MLGTGHSVLWLLNCTRPQMARVWNVAFPELLSYPLLRFYERGIRKLWSAHKNSETFCRGAIDFVNCSVYVVIVWRRMKYIKRDHVRWLALQQLSVNWTLKYKKHNYSYRSITPLLSPLTSYFLPLFLVSPSPLFYISRMVRRVPDLTVNPPKSF